jgi:hypothetical protein
MPQVNDEDVSVAMVQEDDKGKYVYFPEWDKRVEVDGIVGEPMWTCAIDNETDHYDDMSVYQPVAHPDFVTNVEIDCSVKRATISLLRAGIFKGKHVRRQGLRRGTKWADRIAKWYRAGEFSWQIEERHWIPGLEVVLERTEPGIDMKYDRRWEH